jgi:hypothetical protein
MTLSPASVADIFVQDDQYTAWKDHLLTIGPPPVPVVFPAGDHLLETLRYLEIPERDLEDVAATVPNPESKPDLWWFLERTVHALALKMGDVEGPPRFAALRDPDDPRYRYFYVHLFVAALPQARAWFQERGIPDAIVQATLADLGRNVEVHRKRTGHGGLGTAWWLLLHFRGMIYQLGRLQFELARLGTEGAMALEDAGVPATPDSRVLSIHIPDFLGPMTPEACDDAMSKAHEFFARYFPDERIVAATCSSWLLDPALKRYLRPESNIIQFQERFKALPGGWESNRSILQFVFGPAPEDLDLLPQRTSLERAVVTHLKAGNDWMGTRGWFPW